MSQDDFQRRADQVRAIPLEVVLRCWDAVRDRRDKSQWRTPRGPLSVTGVKFYNWHTCQGGGGAIDLVMHLGGWDARQAIEWLAHHLGGHVTGTQAKTYTKASGNPTSAASFPSSYRVRRQQLRLPTPSPANLQRVRRYLIEHRGLAATILNSLINQGKLYADTRGNAVFLMVTGKPNRPIGAELRGTGNHAWRGLAPGTSKNAGYFWIGHAASKQIVLCESAIDAISCFQLRTQHHGAQRPTECICISTAGVRSGAPWLGPLLSRGYDIYCGFDADEPGESASRQMITRHPTIHRLRPPKHDWNDTLIARRS
jgi:hypothetical protein